MDLIAKFDQDDASVLYLVVFVICVVLVVRAILKEKRRRDYGLRGSSRRPPPPPVVPPSDWTSSLERPQAVPPYQVAVPSDPPAATTGLIGAPALDLATFAPMSDADIKSAAQSLTAAGTNLFAIFRFGLRNQIPPASDPRTALIDKALVAHGLLTPEELLEIHTVGQAMDQAKPQIEMAHFKAQEVVRQTLEERQRIKAQKKAEATEREKQHAAAVAQRKATDIIYLGRGVSKGLADRQSDVAKLTAAGLPVLATPADIATALNLTIPRLRWLAYHADATPRSHYVRFTIPKRSGGVRHLFAPHEELATAQEWILRNLLDKVPTHDAAHGFVKTRSTVTNATPHVDKDIVINTDLENFFPTITFPRVLGLFKQLGYSPAAATILALLCTESPRRPVTYAGKPFHVATGPRALPQGACTSPALSNLIARRLDSRLTGVAKKLGYTYTRYADDLTFSFQANGEAASAAGSSDQKIGYLLARIRHIAQDEGFTINEPKTRVLKRAARQEVTGVVVNKRPTVPRKLRKRLRAILHHAKQEGLPAQNRQNHPHFEGWLTGTIAYVNMVNPDHGKALATKLEELR